MATKARKDPVNTEDRVMEGVVTAAAWAERNRRLVTLGTVALVAIIMAGWAYFDYRAKLDERAAVRLDEIRMTANTGAPPQQVRAELSEFITQFGATPYEAEARLYLAGIDVQSNDLDAAIRTLTPAADLSAGTPVAFRAASSLAAVEEMAGRPDEAIQWHERIERSAAFEFQREEAIAEQARLYAQTGDLDRSAALYRQLLDAEETEEAGAASVWAVRLGEIEALRDGGGTYVQAPPPLQIPAPGTGVPEQPVETAPAESGDGSEG